ncbi:MAG: iron-sulfur cluster-binding domain-containing protein [Oscillospiraceae bacterium]|nr:iron-sulfur cluster-binding domain-containing protein [Oscillospiraceae bacterium]
MKYGYDKKLLKSLSVGPFLGQVKLREKMIAEADDSIPTSIYNANILAKKLHPNVQYAVIEAIEEHADAKSFKLVPDKEKGTEELAYFRAGQYVSIALDIGEARLNKPYTIRSCPKDALNGSYTVTVKRNAKGFASDYILDNWQVGTKVKLSGPLGEFYHQELRDAKQVVALAGGSGITPFYSMAAAIADGTEDFTLTILYGSRTKASILLEDELDAVVKAAGGKVKVVHVLSEEEAEGCEKGFITAELIKKYAPEGDYSVYLCGPKAMYAFAKTELPKLGLKDRRIRKELPGEYGDPTGDAAYPKEAAGKEFALTVLIRGKEMTLSCRADQTLLDALEKAGVRAPSHCRSGECGWCHSRLVSGDVYIPEDTDGRRAADKKFGWVHPCCSYPLSDVTIDVPVIE